MTCSCTARPAHIPNDGSNREFRPLFIKCVKWAVRFPSLWKNSPEITAIFTLPCSSRAIRSASSISNVPNPYTPSVAFNRTKEQGTYLMLKLGWIAPMHRHRSTIDMQLSHNTASAFGALRYELRTEGSLVRALAQPQQADEDVPFWVFIGQERLPPPVGRVIST